MNNSAICVWISEQYSRWYLIFVKLFLLCNFLSLIKTRGDKTQSKKGERKVQFKFYNSFIYPDSDVFVKQITLLKHEHI